MNNFADSLGTSIDAAREAIADVASNNDCNTAVIKGEVQDVNDYVSEVQLEMRAGHFNSAARLVNKLSSCCISIIYKLHGANNLPIHDLPRTYSDLQDLQGTQSSGCWYPIWRKRTDEHDR